MFNNKLRTVAYGIIAFELGTIVYWNITSYRHRRRMAELRNYKVRLDRVNETMQKYQDIVDSLPETIFVEHILRRHQDPN